MATLKLSDIALQTGTSRTLYITWTWDGKNTKEYQVQWQYNTGDKTWFDGTVDTVTADSSTSRQSTYDAPSNAIKVRVRVKPISLTYTKKNKEVNYWTKGWTSYKSYNFDKFFCNDRSYPSVTVSG